MRDAFDGIIESDLNTDWAHTVVTAAAWAYPRLYDEIKANPLIPDHLKDDEFGRRRGPAIVQCMIAACEKHQVPWDRRRLPANGQQKLLIKAGRLTIIQEPILTLGDAPRASEYKRSLAQHRGATAQLELPLGDRPERLLDFSQGLMAVVLHGPTGTSFRKDHRELGAMMLAVPNAEYTGWVKRFDLHDLAMFGSVSAEREDQSAVAEQQDRVRVRTRQRRAVERDVG